MTKRVKKTSVSLYEDEIEIVDGVADQHGLNFSSALRMIVRRWAGLEDERIRFTEKNRQALEEQRIKE